MQRVTYNECLHNHAANLGRYMVDGCHEYSPRNIANDLLCAACNCHRNYHRKVTIFDPDITEASGTYSPVHNIVAPKEESFNLGAALPLLDASGEDENLNQLAEPKLQLEKKKKPKSKFTKEQVEKMRAFSEMLGWSTRDRNRVSEISLFCATIGISKIVFTTWLRNNKKHYGGGSSSKKNCSSTGDKN